MGPAGRAEAPLRRILAASLIRRILAAALTWLLMTLLLYGAVRLIPGEAWTGAPDSLPPQAARWEGAGVPWSEGYAAWMGRVARLDLGTSVAVEPGRPVAALLGSALPWTILLGALAFTLTFALAAPMSVLMAWQPGAPWERAAAASLYALHALPVFWIALALQHGIAARLGVLPLMGPGPGAGSGGSWGVAASHWVLPTLALSLGTLALAVRLSRGALVQAARAPLARAARARGASRGRVLATHALRHAAVPMATLGTVMLPAMVSGSVLVESVFALPGMGRLFFVAASRRDAPVLLGVALVTAAATLAASILGDLVHRLLDPRLASESLSGEPS